MHGSVSCNITKASYLDVLDCLSKNKSMHCSVRSCRQSSESHQQGEARLPALHLSSSQRTVPSLRPRACRSGLWFSFLRWVTETSLLQRAAGCTRLLPCSPFSPDLVFSFFLSSFLLSSLALLLSFPLVSVSPLVLTSLEAVATCGARSPWVLEI